MTLNNVSLDSLRTLVIAQDAGGFGRASERLGRTPSAVSLQMKRLQEEIGVPLFRKQGRKTRLTEQGKIVLRGNSDNPSLMKTSRFLVRTTIHIG